MPPNDCASRTNVRHASEAATRSAPDVSIIIPTFNEAERIGALVEALAALVPRPEIIIADGGSGDGTLACAQAAGADVTCQAPRGRGPQLNAGASHARGRIFLFLHADCALSQSAYTELRLAMSAPGPMGGAFRFSLGDVRSPWARVYEKGVAVRNALFKLPYGDQGLFARREAFALAGPFPAWPFFEDVAWFRALRRAGPTLFLRAELKTSARRFEQRGWGRSAAFNLCLLALFVVGVPPTRLARWYVAFGAVRRPVGRKRMFIRIAAPALLFLEAACATKVRQPSAPVLGSTTEEALAARSRAEAAWASVLRSHVDDTGAVDFKAIAAEPAELGTFVAWLGKVSPENAPHAFPRKEDRLAYHLNAYNALAMYGVIEAGIPPAFDSFFKRVGFFYGKKHLIGGDWMSLYDHENEVVRALGEPRIHFALNCMSTGCPRLPREPFQADRLEAQLQAVTLEFFNAPRHVRVDTSARTAHLSEILSFFTEDFVKPGVSDSLIAYVNKYRSEKIDPNYRVRFIPYDWSVRAQK